MKEKLDSYIASIVFVIIVCLSFLGMVYPIMNPTGYSEVMMYNYMIPMVQHRTKVISCECRSIVLLTLSRGQVYESENWTTP